MEPLTLNQPRCDYLRLTTYNGEAARAMVRVLIGETEESPAQWGQQQYKGWRYPRLGLAYGQTTDSTPHHLIQVSGGNAHQALKLLRPFLTWSDVRVTRLDVQITTNKPGWYEARHFVDALRNKPWRGRRPGRTPYLYDSGGDDSVYYGNISYKQVVIYVKYEDYLRYELRFGRRSRKQDMSGTAAATLAYAMSSEEPIGGLLLGELTRWPDHPVTELFEKLLSGYDATKVRQVSVGDDNRMVWLAGILPTIRKMMLDHDTGHRVQQWFSDMLEDVKEGIDDNY